MASGCSRCRTRRSSRSRHRSRIAPCAQRMFKASIMRAENGDSNDTRAIVTRLAQLRAERAKLLGYPDVCGVRARRPDGEDTRGRDQAADRSRAAGDGARRAREAADMQKLIDKQSGGFKLAPWDWQYYSEQVRKARYDLDESQIKPYFELNRVLTDGVFFAANKLYGITFKERKDIPVYQPDVRVFEVRDANGTPMALFYCDYFKRDNKGGGAWRISFVDQSGLLGTKPVMYNVANFTKPAPGQPALLSFDDVTTMFHEFGHALHGMFSNVEYPTLAGTSVPRDFVEFPSQFNEHWALEPTVFANYAKHYQTGAPMPEELVQKIRARVARSIRDSQRRSISARRCSTSRGTRFRPMRRCRTSTRSKRRRSSVSTWTCELSRRVIARRTSRTSGTAGTPPDTTRICGARCSTTTRTRGSPSTAG